MKFGRLVFSFKLFVFSLSLFFVSCAQVPPPQMPQTPQQEPACPPEHTLPLAQAEKPITAQEAFDYSKVENISENPQPQPLILTFAGDIMSHSVNSRMKDYAIIYDDVRSILTTDSLSFANFETPVDKDKPDQTYPTFNVNPRYVEAAITGGFDVFSLANNHSNDQGLDSLKKTKAYFDSLTDQNVYSSGLKNNKTDPFSHAVIEKDGWKILFVAISEFFNAYGESHLYINHVPPVAKNRQNFAAYLKKLKQDNPCDLFIVSIHVSEPEYFIPVTKERKEYFHSLLALGVDIIWASHPHVMQEWELIKNPSSKNDQLIMYSMGNFISGQRYRLNLENPAAAREYTGDAWLLQAELKKGDNAKGEGIKITDLKPILITNYVKPDRDTVVKLFTNDFIQTLSPSLQVYYKKRFELMQKIKGTIIDKTK